MEHATPGPSAAPGERGRPEQRSAFLAGAVDHVLAHGVGTLSLRPLAAALGTSDRMLLYYFGSRDRLLGAVLEVVGERLQRHLTAALPADPLAPGALVTAVAGVLLAPGPEPLLRLYVEVSGLAARGQEPFRTVAAAVAGSWHAWLAERLDAPEEEDAAAAGVLAALDGLLLLRFVHSADRAAQAADWLSARLGG